LLISSATIPKIETSATSAIGDQESSKPATMKRAAAAEAMDPELQRKRMCVAPADKARSTLTATMEEVTGFSWPLPTPRKVEPFTSPHGRRKNPQ
jgi:hypothetical protein